MKIAVGTKNKAKLEAVESVFTGASIISLDVSSGVSSQPLSDSETLIGAKNRAATARAQANSQMGIGLEGGIVETNEGMYLCNWGALATENGRVLTAGGARIRLPDEVAEGVRGGTELADVMDAYTKLHDVRSNQGAIGIFTADTVNRREMFIHVVKLLKGQHMYYNKIQNK